MLKNLTYTCAVCLLLTSCKSRIQPVEEISNVQPSITLKSTTNDLSHAESVVYDSSTGLLYVSIQGEQEPGDGSIATLNLSGELQDINFAQELNNPKGIAIFKDKLYVSDVTELVEIDLKKGTILNKYHTGDEQFLNDVAIDVAGNVYVSDMRSSSIYKLDQNGSYTKWLTSLELENPNGLLVVGNDLYVAGWGLEGSENKEGNTQGRFLKLDLKTKNVEKVTELPVGNLDGIQVYDDNHFLVSDWRRGTIYKISKTGKTELFLQSEFSVGDILYIRDKKILALPLNRQNKVEIYQVN